MPEFLSQLPFEIGRRVELRGNESSTWVVITSSVSDFEVIENFSLEIAAFTRLPFRVVDAQGLPFRELHDLLRRPANDGVVLKCSQGFDPTTWTVWDINRSGFQRLGPIFLWLSPAELAQFVTLAPNLRSFVGGSIFALSSSGEQMSDLERVRRLQELETHYGISSKEVIDRAQAGSLPPEPHFVEWLVLLRRGDLV